MNDVCNFIPTTDFGKNIKYYHFVYETGNKALNSPFFFSKNRMVLVAKGNGIIKTNGREYTLEPGTLFFTFQNYPSTITAPESFSYIYISFDGSGGDALLLSLGITAQNNVYKNFGHLYEFWISSIRRVNHSNANILTESVFMYTLSFINNSSSKRISNAEKFDCILEYIESNFTDQSLSLKKVSDLFFYSEKYFSALFIKKMDIKFTDYLNKLRIDYAKKIIEENDCSVTELSANCGFSDPFYFSKVFKKLIGKTPTDYIKNSKSL